MAFIRIDIQAAEAIDRMRRRAARVRTSIDRAVLKSAQLMAGRIAETQFEGSPGRRPSHFRQADSLLAVRSGSLRRSIRAWQESGSVGAAYVGVMRQSPAARYAGILETGGEISPVNARMLAIPIGNALTAAGVARYTSPRDVPGLFPIRTRSGKVFLARMLFKGRGASRKGSIEPMFWLVRSVRIPAKHWLTNGAERHKAQFVQDLDDLLELDGEAADA